MSAPVIAARASARNRRTVLDEALIKRLAGLGTVRRNVPLARHTTFGIGGPADVLVTVRGAAALADAVRLTRQAGAPLWIMGAGSNVLVGDAGVRGVVIDNQAKAVDVIALPEGASIPQRFAEAPRDALVLVTLESGASFAAAARQLGRQGLSGIEWACGIPGTLGGAAVYNAGAYDGCLADVLATTTVLDGGGEERRISSADLRLTYRSSAILRGELPDAVVLSVGIVLRRGDPEEIARRIAELDRQRLDAQPRGRNSGSVFKNPPDRHAWELVDAVGLRGYRMGDAQISAKHCNFIENLGAARAADVAALIAEAQRRVRERFGIDLEREVEFVGEGFA